MKKVISKKIRPSPLNTPASLFKFYTNVPGESRMTTFKASEEIIEEFINISLALIEQNLNSMTSFCILNDIDENNFLKIFKNMLIRRLQDKQ